MALTPVHPKGAAKPAAFYSPAMDAGNTVYFSGQIALTPDGGFINDSLDAEITQVFTNIDALLEAVECDRTNIAKVTVYLDSLEDYAAMNERYMEYMNGHAPARTCIEIAKLPFDAKIEIEVIAVKS